MKNILRFLYFYGKIKLIALRNNSRIDFPIRGYRGLCNSDIGENVRLLGDSWFSSDNCKVKIGDNTKIGKRFTISGYHGKIIIEKNVLIADNVFICNCFHKYTDSKIPISKQGMFYKGDVIIKEGSWIGTNVCILPNVVIGKNAIIGSNAVVTKDVPDYEIWAGVPAKRIRGIK